MDSSANPFAQVALAAKTALLEGRIPEQELLERNVLIAKRLLRKGFGVEKSRAIMTFLENYVLFEDPEMNRTFKEKVIPQDQNNFMSIDEYIKMVERGKIAENLLKGSDLSVGKIASLTNVTVEVVNEIKAELKTK